MPTDFSIFNSSPNFHYSFISAAPTPEHIHTLETACAADFERYAVSQSLSILGFSSRLPRSAKLFLYSTLMYTPASYVCYFSYTPVNPFKTPPWESKWKKLNAEKKSQRQVERERHAYENADIEQEVISKNFKQENCRHLLIKLFPTDNNALQYEVTQHKLKIGTNAWVDFKTNQARKEARDLDNEESSALVNFVHERALDKVCAKRPPEPCLEVPYSTFNYLDAPMQQPSVGRIGVNIFEQQQKAEQHNREFDTWINKLNGGIKVKDYLQRKTESTKAAEAAGRAERRELHALRYVKKQHKVAPYPQRAAQRDLAGDAEHGGDDDINVENSSTND
jgi:hypothetical protein